MIGLVCAALVVLPLGGPKKGQQPKMNQAPAHPSFGYAFYYCPKCNTLQGGFYGKGPIKRLAGPACLSCFHDWHRIECAEFCHLATRLSWPGWEKEQLSKLQGTWTVIHAEKMGSELKIGGYLTIRDDEFEMKQGDIVIDHGKLWLNHYRPEEFDVPRSSERRAVSGIYDLEGDTLRICLGHNRPEEFRTRLLCQPGNIEAYGDQIYMILKRQP